MNDGRDVPSSHGYPHPEASGSIKSSVNAETSPKSAKMPSGDIQVPQSPQPLSLRVDGLNAITVPHVGNANGITYVESSDRGSDTSVEGRQPELQSSSTIAESFTMPPSSTYDLPRPMELCTSQASSAKASTSQAEQQLLDSQRATQTSSVDGDTTMGQQQASSHTLPAINPSNGSVSRHISPRHLSSRSTIDLRLAQGQKRTAAGELKSDLPLHPAPNSDVNGVARRRSKSTGSPAHGSRIAQLSVHIRTRLSYAAAQIEKARQSSEALTQQTQGRPSSMSPSTNTNEHSYRNGIASTPHSTSSSHPQDYSSHISSTAAIQRSSHHRSQSALASPTNLFPIPKLAPPADITSSNSEARRRRPNPNAISKPPHHSPTARHRRHRSHQEPPMAQLYNSASTTGPDTPSLHSTAPTSTPNGMFRPDIHSQNSAMEQDAIETLLFMSSPENSGYRSSPRPLQPAASQGSLNASVYALKNGTPLNRNHQSPQRGKTHGDLGSRNRVLGLEAHAGDEIDRILDQMESDSDD